MKNRMSDLNDRLFAQLDRMSKENMTAEQIETEVKRTEAIVAVADTIVSNANTQLKAAKLFAEHGRAVLPMLPQIGHGEADP